MNIFYLDSNPQVCAEYHCDKHCVKMCVEYAQILSTTHRLLGNSDPLLYKATHIHHPAIKWAAASSANYSFLRDLYIRLCKEYTHRYGRKHKSSTLKVVLKNVPKNIPRSDKLSKIALMMPEKYHSPDPVQSYRNYYQYEKGSFLNYTNRQTPEWL